MTRAITYREFDGVFFVQGFTFEREDVIKTAPLNRQQKLMIWNALGNDLFSEELEALDIYRRGANDGGAG